MENWGYRLNHPMVSFEIQEEIDRTEKGLHVVLKTETGLKNVWIPKKLASFYDYEREGRTIHEVIIPEWLAVKVGLIESE